MIDVRIDAAAAPHLRAAIVEADGVTVTVGAGVPETAPLRSEIEAVTARVRAAHAGRQPSEIAGLKPARDLYRRVGVDPTKLRPSSEALLRRVLRGDGLPVINSLVDINNLCSLESLLPIGLHDLDTVRGAMTLRVGRPGEGYEAIGKGAYSVEGRITVADDLGPCGSPTSDSQRTMITAATTRCLMIIYAPSGYSTAALDSHAALAASRITRFAGGAIRQARVLGREAG
jgi:DNA/RNA-binding domain of Phe-tRNA-synthetase-like protein